DVVGQTLGGGLGRSASARQVWKFGHRNPTYCRYPDVDKLNRPTRRLIPMQPQMRLVKSGLNSLHIPSTHLLLGPRHGDLTKLTWVAQVGRVLNPLVRRRHPLIS